QKGDSNAASHLENGYYSCPLSTTDTNTVGRLTVAVSESGALPVWAEYMVLPANVYDSLVGGSDMLQVDVTQWRGTQPNTLVSNRVDASVGAMASNTLTASALATDAVSEIQSGLATSTALQTVDDNVDAILADTGTTGVIVATNNDKTGYRLSSTGVDDILDEAITEPSAVFGWSGASLRTIVAWLGALARNKITQTDSVQTLRNDDDDADIATAAESDDGTT